MAKPAEKQFSRKSEPSDAELELLTDPNASVVESTDDVVIEERPPIDLDGAYQQAELDAQKMVKIRPRRTVMRTHIGGKWWNFVQGQEQMVPVPVRDWLFEKGVL